MAPAMAHLAAAVGAAQGDCRAARMAFLALPAQLLHARRRSCLLEAGACGTTACLGVVGGGHETKESERGSSRRPAMKTEERQSGWRKGRRRKTLWKFHTAQCLQIIGLKMQFFFIHCFGQAADLLEH
ncbi:uncharacterized protein LOC129052638 isoform X2 [Pongo abelii]|uniref:uncharacterized protein LOC129052638 isoform X2 n=1 Tax=Pongo abelii TaxID=9601 RepID=UPI0023E871C4|nr:uncharacterized protein LOC129052638 isoform X2 [Pongo abelii]